MHLVVVGAGISGLAAAWAAHEVAQARGVALQITVLEAGPSVGGKAVTNKHSGGWLTEEGPTGFLDTEPVLDRLVEIAGLTKLPASSAAAHRFVVHAGKLREIHADPAKFATSGILSPLGMARILRERWIKSKVGERDESVWDFGARRLGAQAADRLLAPMVQGVFAGDAKRISLPAAFPNMAQLEREHGSLFRALDARRKAARSEGASAGGPAGPAGTLTSFSQGLQSLPQALAAEAPFRISCEEPVASVQRAERGGWALEMRDGRPTRHADGLVLATEGWASARLLSGIAPKVAKPLLAVPYPAVTVLSMGFAPQALRHFPQGFGCLIPRGGPQRALGFLFDSHIFSGRAPEGHILVRALYGGSVDPEAQKLSSEQLLATATRELRELFAVAVPPVFHAEKRWQQAIPQYELGHLQRVQQVEVALAELVHGSGPLELAGNALYGVAFGKAAARGWEAGERAALHLLG